MNDELIREQLRAFSLKDAEGPDRDVIRACYAFFDRHNEAFWGGELRPVPILVTPPTSPRAYADAAEFSGFGCKQQMRVRPTCARGDRGCRRGAGCGAAAARTRGSC
jgi:hypothetical protein